MSELPSGLNPGLKNRFSSMSAMARLGGVDGIMDDLICPEEDMALSDFRLHREKIYALLAKHTHALIHDAYKKDKSDGVGPLPPDSKELYAEFAHLSPYFIEFALLRDKIHSQIEEASVQPGDVVRELEKWHGRVASGVDFFGSVTGGVENALMFMMGIAQVVPEVVEREMPEVVSDANFLDSVFEESFGIVGRFANAGIDEFMEQQRRIMVPSASFDFPSRGSFFDSSKFVIKK